MNASAARKHGINWRGLSGRSGERCYGVISFVAHVIGHLLTPLIGRTFFRTVKRFPTAFAGVAITGQTVGIWLLCECVPAGSWPMAGLGLLCLVFYTGLFGMVVVKRRAGTWDAFCDHAASEFEATSAAKTELRE